MTIHPYLYVGLKSIPSDNPWENHRPVEVVEILCDLFKIDKNKIYTKCRKSEYVTARQMLYNIFDKYYKLGRTESGKIFWQDHATAIHSIGKHADNYKTDEVYRANYDGFVDHIENGTPFVLRESEKKIIERQISVAEIYAILRTIKVGETFVVLEDEYLKACAVLDKAQRTEYGMYMRFKFKVKRDGTNYVFERVA